MKVLITGASGFIGLHLAKLLREKSFDVQALVREGSAVSDLKALDIALVTGDVRDHNAVRRAMRGCQHVYHLAADYRLWIPRPETMYEINVQGTRNVMQAALDLGAERMVYTSTVGVWSGSRHGETSHEGTPSNLSEMVGHYKRSKFMAEKEVLCFVEQGLPAVIVNPATPVGTLDRKPTPTGKIIVDFLNGNLPAYLDTGLNFVDVTDVAMGHWLASVHGQIGERYILGNSNMTLREFLEMLARVTGRKPPRVRLSYFPVLMAAYGNEALSRWITHRPPLIPLTGVKMARKYMFFDCTKAVRDLKMPQHSVEKAIEAAAQWFLRQGYVKA